MPIDKTKCCGGHTKKKEESGECCQLEEQKHAEALTYEHSIETKEINYESSEWYLGKHNNEIGTMRQKQRSQHE